MKKEPTHTTVMADEVVRGLAPKPGGVFIDVTLGLGGHAERILTAAGEGARLLGIDRDPEAIAIARKRLSPFSESSQSSQSSQSSDRVQIEQGSFSEVLEIATRCGFVPADGVVADLGISSLQLSEAERGFSFQSHGPLDMRMGPGVDRTAAQLLDEIEVDELARILGELGELKKPRRIARAIIEDRRSGTLNTTRDLAELCSRILPKKKRIHPATQVFQALRIAVNRELEELDRLLDALETLLRPGGRAAIISFHSLEDRAVKRRIRAPVAPSPVRGLPIEDTKRGPFMPVGKKAIKPTEEEITANPRARSAKLRVFERTD